MTIATKISITYLIIILAVVALVLATGGKYEVFNNSNKNSDGITPSVYELLIDDYQNAGNSLLSAKDSSSNLTYYSNQYEDTISNSSSISLSTGVNNSENVIDMKIETSQNNDQHHLENSSVYINGVPVDLNDNERISETLEDEDSKVKISIREDIDNTGGSSISIKVDGETNTEGGY